MIVRAETAADHADIRRINDEAFGETLESELVDAIRASGRFVPELSIVAESRGQSLGHVISSYVDVEPGGSVEPPPQALGPEYFMIRPLARYDRALRGLAAYPPETFGIVY